MRWEALFRDLEGQWSELEHAEFAGEVADRSRLENARLLLRDRLRAQLDRELAFTLLGVGQVRGRVREVGPDWLTLRSGVVEQLVVLAAVTSLTGLSPESAPPGSQSVVAARLDLRYALRALARDRMPVLVHLTDGQRRHGTFDRVGADFAELAEHPPGEPRRRESVRGVCTLPLAALSLVRSA